MVGGRGGWMKQFGHGWLVGVWRWDLYLLESFKESGGRLYETACYTA